jgi:hypothetical protein
MTAPLGSPDEELAEVPAGEGAEPIFIRKLDRLETTYFSNPNGA